MQFKVMQNEMKSLLSVVGPVVSKNNVNPMLQSVLIVVTDNEYMYLEGTDLNTNVLTSKVKVTDSKPGKVCIEYQMLSKIINSIPRYEALYFEEQNDKIQFKSGKVSIGLLKYDTSNYPKLPEINLDKLDKYDVSVFQKILEAVSFSVSHDDTKPHIKSVLLDFKDDKTIAVATDGHRLSYSEIAVDNTTLKFRKKDEGNSVLLPDFFVSYIMKVISKLKSGDNFSFGIQTPKKDKPFIVFASEFGVIYSKLIDSKFPPYEQVIPAWEDSAVCKVRKIDLVNAINRVNIFEIGQEKSAIARVSGNEMKLENITTSRGSINETIACDYNGEDITISFNGSYFLQWLNVMNYENINIMIMGGTNPIVCIPVLPEVDIKKGFFAKYILMPLKISN